MVETDVSPPEQKLSSESSKYLLSVACTGSILIKLIGPFSCDVIDYRTQGGKFL